MNSALRTAGRITLIAGILLLAAGITCGFTVGTIAVPILVTSSVIVNAAAITMLRWKG